MTLDLPQLCARLGLAAPLSGPEGPRIKGLSTLDLAGPTDLCFAERADQLGAVSASHAAAVLVPTDFPECERPTLVRIEAPRAAFFAIAELFAPALEIQGIHPSAVIDPTARLESEVAIGACAVVGSGVHLGARTRVGPGCYLGRGVTLGTDCLIEANVTILADCRLGNRCIIHAGSVIGGDGFGFRWDGERHRKIPQLGRVEIEDDVELGCNCCVDRATLGVTRVRRGTKVDNLVQIAHNTDIGEHVILVSQSGVAGSSTLGTGVVVAGQVAISDHIEVGAGARIGGQSGVTKDIPPGATVFGTPARSMKDSLRELAALAQLPHLLKDFRRQERELAELRARLEALEAERAPTDRT